MNILILLMSCNKDLYEKEEQACRDTFIKDAENANIKYYFYKGGEDKIEIDEENHVMYLPVNDGLAGTSQKTVLAFNEALKMEDWDYLIKTNVSTWLDIAKINKAVERWEGREDRNIYGARFLANDASKKVPFPRGHFTILSRSIVEGIVQWSPTLIKADNFPRTDDTLICLSMLYHMQKILNENYLSRLMEVPSVIAWNEEIQDATEWTDALSVRCKDELNPENTPENMRRVNMLKRSKKRCKNYRRPLWMIETKYGIMQYKMYEQLSTLIDRLKQQNKEYEAEKEAQAQAAKRIEPDPDNKLLKIRERLSGIKNGGEVNVQDDTDKDGQ